MRVTDTLAFLAGTWRLHRSLTDHRTGTSGELRGTAAFSPVPGRPELRYREEGELRFGTHQGPASRGLVWLGLPGGAAEVRFPDGRLFCVVDLAAGDWAADHPCGRDLYHVSYRVLSDDQVEECWLVRGPAKNYQATATLTRCAA
jgi:hypothetical protein